MSDRDKLYFYDATKEIYKAVESLDNELYKLEQIHTLLEEKFQATTKDFTTPGMYLEIVPVRSRIGVDRRAIKIHIEALKKASKVANEEDVVPRDVAMRIELGSYNLLLGDYFFYSEYFSSIRDWVKTVVQRHNINESGLDSNTDDDEW